MKQVGVEAAVTALNSFLGDMKKMDNAIRDLIPGNTLLEKAFVSLSDVVSGFAGGVVRTLEYAIGGLITDFIEFLIDKVKELISSIIEAGNEFQTLSIRLNGMNLQVGIEAGDSYALAMEKATKATKEQIAWLQTLAAASPFSAEAITNVYTMARGFDFSDEEARRLTKDIVDFTAGMGLTNEHLERIIINLGQMKQRGKITGTEIRDLTRGAFLPLDDVLTRVANKMGITVAELTKQISTPEGVPAQIFIDAFQELVEEEPRFIGAAGRLGRTLVAASQNVKELMTSIFGMNTLGPIFTSLGEAVAKIVDQFVFFNEAGDIIKTDMWDRLTKAATRLGNSIAAVIDKLLGLAPSADSIATAMVESVEKISDWVDKNSDSIVEWVKNSAAWIQETLIPAIQDVWKWLFVSTGQGMNTGALEQFAAWIVDVLVPAVMNAAKWIGEVLVPFIRDDLVPVFAALVPLGIAVADVFMAMFGKEEGQEFSDWIHNDLIPAIQSFTQWINDNQELVVFLVKAFIALQVVQIVAAWIAGLVMKLIVFGLAINTIVGVLAFFGEAIALVLPWVLLIGALIASLIAAFLVFGLWIKIAADNIKAYLNAAFVILIETLTKVFDALVHGRWEEAGRAIIEGLIKGLQLGFSFLTSVSAQWVNKWIEFFKSILGIASPSTVFFDIGYNLMLGLMNGIQAGAAMVQSAAKTVAQGVIAAVQGLFNMHSPSVLMNQMGVNVMRGFAQGIMDATGMVTGAMQSAMSRVVMPAAAAPGAAYSSAPASMTRNYNTTNNFNLAINSNAGTEPILQDYSMLQSLAGA